MHIAIYMNIVIQYKFHVRVTPLCKGTKTLLTACMHSYAYLLHSAIVEVLMRVSTSAFKDHPFNKVTYLFCSLFSLV